MTTELHEYDFLMNDDGEVLVIFDGMEGLPDDPFVILRDDSVFLTRSEDADQIKMDKVPKDVMATLKNAQALLVCEVDEDGTPQQVYSASVLQNA